jgi:DNA-binding NarL/FixJ family response regulator
MANDYRIVLADDHVLFRQSVKKILDGISGIRVVGEAGDGIELIDLLRSVDPDMVILDISMPKLGGIEAAREIEQKHPELKVLILTIHKDDAYFQRAISAGAEGYVLKENTDRELIPAITAIRQGREYFPHFS